MSSAIASYGRAGAIGLAVLAVAALASAALPAPFGSKSEEVATFQPKDSENKPLYSCIDYTKKAIKSSDADYDLYERIWRLCGNQIYNQMYLADFRIRREKLIEQKLDERVTMWMVVSITVSGVILAGLQLATSYKLASSGHSEFAKDSEIIIQRDRISLKSSITGVLILGISFAFFIVYVMWIYTITEIPVDRSENLRSTSPGISVIGGLGPPPTASTNAPVTIHSIPDPPEPVSGVPTSGAKPPTGPIRPAAGHPKVGPAGVLFKKSNTSSRYPSHFDYASATAGS